MNLDFTNFPAAQDMINIIMKEKIFLLHKLLTMQSIERCNEK